MASLHVDRIGAGPPTLVLLHGVSANAGVWRPLLAELADWPGQIVVPDLRGHGRSPPARHYSLGHHAADVADLFDRGETIAIVGHSMGGAVGLVLANGCFDVMVERVLAFGTKVGWQKDELAKAAQLAAAPVRWFASQVEAEERFLRVSGLKGLAGDVQAAIIAGVVAEDGRYRLAADSATMRVVGPPFAALMAAAQAPIRLACGSRDPMVGIEDLRIFDPGAVAFAGSGHNPHVEDPQALASLLRHWMLSPRA